MYMLTEEKTKQDSRTKLVLFKCVHIHILNIEIHTSFIVYVDWP